MFMYKRRHSSCQSLNQSSCQPFFLHLACLSECMAVMPRNSGGRQTLKSHALCTTKLFPSLSSVPALLTLGPPLRCGAISSKGPPPASRSPLGARPTRRRHPEPLSIGKREHNLRGAPTPNVGNKEDYGDDARYYV